MNRKPDLSEVCFDCGARLSAGLTCQAIFDEFLVLEFNDPAFGAVHFLSVACFMIQHKRYSDEGLIWIENQMQAYLEGRATLVQIRAAAAQEVGSSKRSWKINRQPDERPLPMIHWSMTITDIWLNFEDAQSYHKLVRRWARTTLEEMKPWLEHCNS
jgi:hypothetical protein